MWCRTPDLVFGYIDNGLKDPGLELQANYRKCVLPILISFWMLVRKFVLANVELLVNKWLVR